MDPHRWSVRVSNATRQGATMFVRSQQVRVGAPLTFDEQHPLPTSLELLLGALGSDVAVSLLTVWLGVVGEEGNTALENVHVKVYVDTFEPTERIDPSWKEALARSPLVSTLTRRCSIC